MFPLIKYIWPGPEGCFGFVRKYDIHTGIDLYCNPDDLVYSIGSGIVTSVENFTGPKAGSPWWNDTQSVLIYDSIHNHTICYGEIEASVKYGQHINEGDIIGCVKTVLKKDKGKPMTMLHFEKYEGLITESVLWALNSKKPTKLINPIDLLNKLKNY